VQAVSSVDLQNLTIAEDGCQLFSAVFNQSQIEHMQAALAQAVTRHKSSVCERDGEVYAARNVLEICPLARTVWQVPSIIDLLTDVLGPGFGLVRGLYFDKPPGQTWALPWHKDLSIAVAPHCGSSEIPCRRKRGTWHCEPPETVLQLMLTLRLHLDPMTLTNGPLEVLPGSHRNGRQLVIQAQQPVLVTGTAGDVFAMRPLLAHRSGRSAPDSCEHRRILHLEFSSAVPLPLGLRWHEFQVVESRGRA